MGRNLAFFIFGETVKSILTMQRFFLSLVCGLVGVCSAAARTGTVVVKGTVIDRPQSKTLLFTPAGEDMRIRAPQRVAIRDGRFSFRVEAGPEAYEVVFADEWYRGAWRSTRFFLDADTVRLTLHPLDRADRNRVVGGPENREMQRMDSVFSGRNPIFEHWVALQQERLADGSYYNAEASALLDRLDSEEDRAKLDSLEIVWSAMQEANRHLSPEAAETDRRMRAYADSVEALCYEHIRNHRSLAGYYALYQRQLNDRKGGGHEQVREEIYRTVYAPHFPEHPYTARLDTLFYRRIRLGGPFPDFEAPDLDGRMHRLSERIAGRVALVNLWASWCGPCRRHGLAVMPIYDAFREKGFTVVGVARETENDGAMRQAVAKDGYPWLNLLELDDRAGIWRLYGVENGGGGQFLIDRDGTVLAINPTAEELRAILAEKLR